MRLATQPSLTVSTPSTHPHCFVFALSPTAQARTCYQRWIDQGYEASQIWNAFSLRAARIVERNYAVPCSADVLLRPPYGPIRECNLHHLYSTIDHLLLEMMPAVNITGFIYDRLNHLDITLSVQVDHWRLLLRSDYFPW